MGIFGVLVECHTARRGPEVAVVVHIQLSDDTQLLEIGNAARGVRSFARLLQRGQQHRRQNRDDRDDDQQFDQCESMLFHLERSLSPCPIERNMKFIVYILWHIFAQNASVHRGKTAFFRAK